MDRQAAFNVHFIAYNGPSHAKGTDYGHSKSKISWQKHAGREYHRRLRSRQPVEKQTMSVKLSNIRSKTDYEAANSVSSDTKDRDDSETPSDHSRSLTIRYHGVHRWDPFGQSVQSETSDYVGEMLYHAISEQWKVFVASSSIADQNRIRHSVLANCMASKATMYTIVFAGATHNAFLHAGTEASRHNQILRTSYKTRAIAELRKALNDLRGPATEELLMCIITLAAHGSGDELRPPSVNEFEAASPLSKAQDFHYYAAMRWEEAHLEAIHRLIDARGGLSSIDTPALFGAIMLADIFSAFRNLRPPMFPLIIPTSVIMSDWPVVPGVNPSLSNFATGFNHLFEDVSISPIFAIIQNIRSMTIGYDLYLDQNDDGQIFARLLNARNWVQHDLLSLDENADRTIALTDTKLDDVYRLQMLSSLRDYQYMILRYSVMIYVLLVLFPLPRSTGVHSKLAIRLMRAINGCGPNVSSNQGFLIWAVMLGGAVAEGDIRTLFIDRLLQILDPAETARRPPRDSCVQITHLAQSWWHRIEDQCKNYLWYRRFDFEREISHFWKDFMLELANYAKT